MRTELLIAAEVFLSERRHTNQEELLNDVKRVVSTVSLKDLLAVGCVMTEQLFPESSRSSALVFQTDDLSFAFGR